MAAVRVRRARAGSRASFSGAARTDMTIMINVMPIIWLLISADKKGAFVAMRLTQ